VVAGAEASVPLAGAVGTAGNAGGCIRWARGVAVGTAPPVEAFGARRSGPEPICICLCALARPQHTCTMPRARGARLVAVRTVVCAEADACPCACRTVIAPTTTRAHSAVHIPGTVDRAGTSCLAGGTGAVSCVRRAYPSGGAAAEGASFWVPRAGVAAAVGGVAVCALAQEAACRVPDADAVPVAVHAVDGGGAGAGAVQALRVGQCAGIGGGAVHTGPPGFAVAGVAVGVVRAQAVAGAVDAGAAGGARIAVGPTVAIDAGAAGRTRPTHVAGARWCVRADQSGNTDTVACTAPVHPGAAQLTCWHGVARLAHARTVDAGTLPTADDAVQPQRTRRQTVRAAVVRGLALRTGWTVPEPFRGLRQACTQPP